MKCMKRLLAIVLGAALLCPMTAYAGQTEEAKALYDQVQEKSNAITDMNAFYHFKIKFGGSMIENAGLTASDMRLEMNVKMNHLTEPALMAASWYLHFFEDAPGAPAALFYRYAKTALLKDIRYRKADVQKF